MDFTSYLKFFSVALVSIIVIDFAWVGLVMSRFYKTRLSNHARLVGGLLRPNMESVIIVYLLLALGFVIFVLPEIIIGGSAFLWGAALGLIIYGVYEFTNYALLNDWPLSLVFIDLAWGIMLCGTVAKILAITARYI